MLTCLPSAEALDEVVQGPQRPGAFGAAGADRGRARLALRARQGAPDRAARRQGRGVHRRRSRRHARHGHRAQGGGLSRRRRRSRAQGRNRGARLHRRGALFRPVRRRQQGQADQQPAGHRAHGRRRRGHGARPQGRRRRRPDDQGGGRRQRRLDPVRHPRAVDGAAPLPAGAGRRHRPVALLRSDRRLRRPRRCGDADARPRRRALSECIDMGLGSHDNAVMVDVIGAMPRAQAAKAGHGKKAKKAAKKKAKPAAKKVPRKPKRNPKPNPRAKRQHAHRSREGEQHDPGPQDRARQL